MEHGMNTETEGDKDGARQEPRPTGSYGRSPCGLGKTEPRDCRLRWSRTTRRGAGPIWREGWRSGGAWQGQVPRWQLDANIFAYVRVYSLNWKKILRALRAATVRNGERQEATENTEDTEEMCPWRRREASRILEGARRVAVIKFLTVRNLGCGGPARFWIRPSGRTVTEAGGRSPNRKECFACGNTRALSAQGSKLLRRARNRAVRGLNLVRRVGAP